MPERYILQPSEKLNHWVCTDQENKIVCVFENHKFNETQKVTTLEDFNPDNFMKLARYMREMGDWLRDNHYEKIF
jgi:hypothetical protein